MKTQAIEKINRELNEFKGGNKEKAVSQSIAEMLEGFCEENEAFAEVIASSDKSLSECCEFAVKDCGDSISDIEAYKRAVRFYIPGADIEFCMKIVMPESGGGKKTMLNLSLESFM